MFQSTTERVSNHTSEAQRRKLDQQLLDTIDEYRSASPYQISKRLAELDDEWDLERVIEIEAPLMIGLGAGLGLFHSPKWFGLSAAAAAMVILHNTQGWYPLLPLFQRMGIRSQNDIETERNALRVLRRDHEKYARQSRH
ncbi:hypothetical protein [Marinobacter salicampi]|uniref:hypothetical protein n=1 Tax=Marinobacter salicampi TaxID=435907 RepID=UPI001407E8FA|nr:hypothetical protein [Marinobacter salicampi]